MREYRPSHNSHTPAWWLFFLKIQQPVALWKTHASLNRLKASQFSQCGALVGVGCLAVRMLLGEAWAPDRCVVGLRAGLVSLRVHLSSMRRQGSWLSCRCDPKNRRIRRIPLKRVLMTRYLCDSISTLQACAQSGRYSSQQAHYLFDKECWRVERRL